MRKLLSSVIILVVAFAVTSCATMGGGGYVGPKPYPGPLGDVVAGNLALVCPGDVFIGPPVNRCLRHIGGGIGRYVGLGYPMYWGGPSGLRLSDADKVAILCGLGTGAVATLSGGTIRTVLSSGILGYVACRVIGMTNGRSRGGSSREEVVIDPGQIPPPPTGDGPQAPSSRKNDWDERLRNQANVGGNSWFGSYRGCQEQGMFTLKNETNEFIRVFQNHQPYAVIPPRQSKCGTPLSGGEPINYEAEIVSAIADGYTATAGVVRRKPEGHAGGIWVWR